MTLTVNEHAASALAEALNSYMYWELSDMRYRSSGFVMEPGSDDADVAKAIAECQDAIDLCGEAKGDCVLPEAIRSLALDAVTFYLDNDPDEWLDEDEDLRPALEALLVSLAPAAGAVA